MRRLGVESFGIMENDPDRVSVARTHAADTVAHGDPIGPTRPMHRSMMNWEDHAFTLPKRYNLGTRLQARALLSEYELSAREINVRTRKQERDP